MSYYFFISYFLLEHRSKRKIILFKASMVLPLLLFGNMSFVESTENNFQNLQLLESLH